MSQSFNPYAVGPVAEAPMETRSEFVRKTYTHLAGAIGVFALLEALLIQLVPAQAVFGLLNASPYSWLLVLGAFMAVSWIANKWAYGGASKTMQYAGLGLYIVAEAVIFLPILMIATTYDPAAIGKAGAVTGFMVLGLTAIAFTTRKDFTFLGGILKIGFLVALGLIVAAVFFPGLASGMGLWFSLAMVVLASGSILYNTSAIMYHYAPGQHVAASLSLFASVALLFWYVLRIFMSRD
ncbi:Bax inhibitor-1/YccA family protein [Luteolibacter marinus]|uniref:Bax inhibitor-1/YccA family protein n=1 Tax=Luteolibacter marinus TaxID=2776705 RepID=UPI001865CCD5|nr:Bax inhibitor-1 family protein [Luteolibacter marinus]